MNMFKKVTQQEIVERFDSLPQDMREAITDESVAYNIEQLGIKYKLRVDRVGDLVDEVGMVMLGFKQTSDFINSLSKRLEIDRETAESLAVDVDNEVFKKIRESLRDVQFADKHPHEAAAADPDHGQSPARDSLLKEVERHGNDGEDALGFTSASDYSSQGFMQDVSSTPQATRPAPTPYEQTVMSDEEKVDPQKTFKDHLEKKLQAVKPVVNADPYRESID